MHALISFHQEWDLQTLSLELVLPLPIGQEVKAWMVMADAVLALSGGSMLVWRGQED